MTLITPVGYDNERALRLAAACEFAYDLFEHPEVAPPTGHELLQPPFRITLNGQAEVFGMALVSTANAVVAFRGTDSLPDFLADATYAQSGVGLRCLQGLAIGPEKPKPRESSCTGHSRQ